VQVAQALLEDPRGEHWGYDTSKKSGVKAGVLYPLFKRMLEERWVTDGWAESEIPGRPPRRYYELTSLGIARLGGLLAEASTEPRFASLNLKPGTAR
jgi:PadR family transcriptional regulator, regulatory protein PadR